MSSEYYNNRINNYEGNDVVKNERVRTSTLTRVEEKKTCPVCGKEFWGLKKAKFDTRECRDKDYYTRHEDEIRKRQSAAYQKRKKAAKKATGKT